MDLLVSHTGNNCKKPVQVLFSLFSMLLLSPKNNIRFIIFLLKEITNTNFYTIKEAW